jgi:DNA-binding NarL/FixJ family response regulator
VDDHPPIRHAIASYLSREPDFEVVAELDRGAEVEPAIREHEPDLLILDLSMEEGFDPEPVVRRLQGNHPDLRIVILSAHDEPRWVQVMIEAGIPGYVIKTEPPHVFLDKVRAVLNGRIGYSESLLESFAAHYGHNAALTAHEQRLLQGIANGKTTKELCAEFSVAERTLRGYLSEAFQKLGVQSRGAAVAEALRRGLIE